MSRSKNPVEEGGSKSLIFQGAVLGRSTS